MEAHENLTQLVKKAQNNGSSLRRTPNTMMGASHFGKKTKLTYAKGTGAVKLKIAFFAGGGTRSNNGTKRSF